MLRSVSESISGPEASRSRRFPGSIFVQGTWGMGLNSAMLAIIFLDNLWTMRTPSALAPCSETVRILGLTRLLAHVNLVPICARTEHPVLAPDRLRHPLGPSTLSEGTRFTV